MSSENTMQCTLEGLESSWDSPGLGLVKGSYEAPPTIGDTFFFRGENVRDSIRTGTVKRVRTISDSEIGFRTKRTTYILCLNRKEPTP